MHFPNGCVSNLKIEKCIDGSCSCDVITNKGVIKVYEGQYLIKNDDGEIIDVLDHTPIYKRIFA